VNEVNDANESADPLGTTLRLLATGSASEARGFWGEALNALGGGLEEVDL